MPRRTPLNAVIHGKIDGGEYTIEKVYFESLPGFFRHRQPLSAEGQGRQTARGIVAARAFPRRPIPGCGSNAVSPPDRQGEERFEDEGRSFMQSRCVQLARMGCVVFLYDMIGYGDSEQFRLDWVHQFSRHRIKLKQAPATGLLQRRGRIAPAKHHGHCTRTIPFAPSTS